MSHVNTILSALEATGESMTCTRIARLTGLPRTLICNYMPRLCKAGTALRSKDVRPREYKTAGAAPNDIVSVAKASQPKWVFDLGAA